MNETIITIIAIGAAIGNVIAFLFAKVELRAQKKETEHLTRLTSELGHKVQRLATGLDQRISRLNRLRDLVTGLTQAISTLRQESQPQSVKLAAAIQIEMTKPELIALVNASKDTLLQSLGKEIVANVENERLPIAWNIDKYEDLSIGQHIEFGQLVDEIRNRQYALAVQVHTRIIQLIEDATNVSENSAVRPSL